VPILRIKEIRGMSTEDRDKKISELKAELARLKTMIRAGGAVENPARVRELRKTIAKVLTIENENKRKLQKTEEKQENNSKKEKKSK
jgi:large subunit ribosomal protein L29